MASASATTFIRAALGPPLGSDSARRRHLGRIGGSVGQTPPEVTARLARALGPGAQILGPDHRVVVDADTCFVGDDEVRDREQWRDLLRQDRLGAIEGAFALAALEPDDTLVLARDALGERTMYYVELAGALVFASTVAAILASDLVARRLDFAALGRYLSYAYLPGAATLVAGVREVLPGETLRYRQGRLESSRSWSVPAEPGPDAGAGEDQLTLRLRHSLERAVRRRLPAGEPVGAFLSGGLDSSLVVALASRLHAAPVLTWSISFGAEHRNELPWSTMVAEHCRTHHHVVELTPAAVLHHLDEAIAFLSDPIGDPLTVPNALLFREAATEVGVVLNGEGGDPCFGGPKNIPMLLAEIYGNPAAATDPWSRERSYLRAHQKCYDDLGEMVLPEVHAALAAAPLEAELTAPLSDPRWGSLVSRLMAMNVRLKGAHHILAKVDAESAPFGVLPRAPLFDRGVVETAFAIPPGLKLKGTVEKYLLKRAVADLLPQAILERPKSGMLVPVEAWFQGPLIAHARERLLDGLSRYRLFDRTWLERLLANKLAGARPRRGVKIWLLLTLEAWLRTVFEGRDR